MQERAGLEIMLLCKNQSDCPFQKNDQDKFQEQKMTMLKRAFTYKIASYIVSYSNNY